MNTEDRVVHNDRSRCILRTPANDPIATERPIMNSSVFRGCIPAIMTPCGADRVPDFDALVEKAQRLLSAGMTGVVYCGSMGDWPLLTDAQRQEGVRRLVEAGVPVVVGTGRAESGGRSGSRSPRG